MRMLDDIGQHVVAEGQYSVEFELKGLFLFIHLRFWRDNQLCRVVLKRTGRSVRQTQAEKSLLSSLLAAISTRPNPVCASGCSLELIEELDKNPLFTFGVQSFKRFDEVSSAKLMHKESYSVFGRIDFFSVLKYLVVSLGGSLDMECVLLAPELSKDRTLLSAFTLLSWVEVLLFALFIGHQNLLTGCLEATHSLSRASQELGFCHRIPHCAFPETTDARIKEPGECVVKLTSSHVGIFLHKGRIFSVFSRKI